VSGGLEDVAMMRRSFDRRRRRMVEMLRSIDGVELMTPQGAFYAFPDLTAFLGRTIAGNTPETTVDLAALILDEARVAIVPGEAFGAPGYARLSFALGDDDLGEGITRIADLLNG
jgi:aspartate/methionine/tyrosine aminotransferase